jgi:heme/copper-type cytochrome/quinol oxidase subunit 3
MTALALPPAAPPARRNVAIVGTGFAIAAGVMLIGGLLASYFGARQEVFHAGKTWVDIKKTPLPNVALAVTYASLLLSSFTVQWVVSAVKLNDRRQAYVAIGLTLLLAGAFINGLTFCWGQAGLKAGGGGFADHMYALTVTHLLLVIAAIVLLIVMGFRVIGGQFGPRNSEFVISAALFWHFTVVAGAAVWWCVWFLNTVPHRSFT